ncbi:hypothetical protein ACFOZ7_17915, partial [Natribaculum luteum]
AGCRFFAQRVEQVFVPRKIILANVVCSASRISIGAHSALGTILERATSLRNDIKRSFRESVENLLSWALNSPNRSTDELMHQIEGMVV